MKKTITEKRAARALAHLTDPAAVETFAVDWKKSRTWGRTASVNVRGGRAALASGCGYDKLSACVVEYLSEAPAPELVAAIRGCGGSGIRNVIDKARAAGWNLEHVHDGNTVDVFRLSRITPRPVPAPLAALRHHVTGAIERGEAEAITEIRA